MTIKRSANDRNMAKTPSDTLSFGLTASGMANIAATKFENDFAFVVGDRRYDCPSLMAEFLSPRIGRLHAADPTISEIAIDTADPRCEFETFLLLGRGDRVSIAAERRSFFISIAAELENFELYWHLQEPFFDSLTLSSFCEEIGRSLFLEFAPEKVISFLASHFCETDRSFLSRLPISTIRRFLSHESLKIESEDSLYEFVTSLFDRDAETITLLEQIRFEFLTPASMAAFIGWSCDHFAQFSHSIEIWKSLCVRLSLSVSPTANPRRWHRAIRPSGDGCLHGIIAHLTRECGGNVHDRGIVDVSEKSPASGCPPKNAADLQSETYISSPNAPGQWLCYDFKSRRVTPSHYSIRCLSSSYHLRSWVLEGSVDGSSWRALDDQANNATMTPTHQIGTFSIPHSFQCRFIRLRQTGKTADGSDHLVLFAFEIFGLLREGNPSSTA
jgi:hypothetical protein